MIVVDCNECGKDKGEQAVLYLSHRYQDQVEGANARLLLEHNKGRNILQ